MASREETGPEDPATGREETGPEAPGPEVADQWGARFARLASGYRGALAIGLVLIVAACISMYLTWPVLTGQQPIAPSSRTTFWLIIWNSGLAFGFVALLAWILMRVLRQRRPLVSDGRLDLRLVGDFLFIAIVPTLALAIFASFTVILGYETYFGERTEAIIDRAKTATKAYVQEHNDLLTAEIQDISAQISKLSDEELLASREAFNQRLAGYAFFYRMAGVFVIDAQGRVLGGSDPKVAEIPVTPDIQRLEKGDPIVYLSDRQLAAVMKLPEFPGAFLFATRDVNPALLGMFGETKHFIEEFEQSKKQLGENQILFAISYAVVGAVILTVALIWGMRAANRIVQPIGSLVVAAERVRTGDLSARVQVPMKADEIGVLGRAFNRMTGQLQAQRNELIEANRQFDRRRRFTEAVLSGVTAAVIGLDAEGQITLVNRSALSLLGGRQKDFVGRDLLELVPELGDLLRSALLSNANLIQGQVDLVRGGKLRHVTVRVTSETGLDETKGYVVTLDDVTELVTAQRMSAWADIARRIAHEMKNPLTPIQLSAERLRRKYRKEIESNPEIFEQCTETIIRQVNDIGRMVDEFSTFARMPTAVIREEDPVELVEKAIFMYRVANSDIEFVFDAETSPRSINCDARLVSQALINVLKNACEAVNARILAEGDEAAPGIVRIEIIEHDNTVSIQVTDNGCGLPREGRNRLTEPYMTTRSKGTGLGLAIVRKIMEDHGGTLVLEDAPEPEQGRRGAMVRLTFPKEPAVKGERATGREPPAEEPRPEDQPVDQKANA
ncbi:MAG: ATP-binding protein [Alphaproteobacteria bacterium]